MGPRTATASEFDVSEFIPEKHLAFRDCPDILTMQDLGMAPDVGISPVAVTQPFELFSHEAIQIMRSEIFKPEVVKNHTFSSNLAPAQLRGYARNHAPFIFAAWTHPETVAIVSKLAGVDLVPWGDYEIAHINLSFKDEEQVKAELTAIEQEQSQTAACNHKASSQDNVPIVGWHQDSYPFVCVLMMSDCTNMVGGETALRTANGGVIRIRSPAEGCAIVLQGRHIVHQALRALGAKERITAVTSYRPRSSLVKDHTMLRTVRPVSDLNELYYDFAEYRLEIMEDRLRHARNELRARRGSSKKFNTRDHKTFLVDSMAFMQQTNQEIVEEDKIRKDYIEMIDVPNVVVEDPDVSNPSIV